MQCKPKVSEPFVVKDAIAQEPVTSTAENRKVSIDCAEHGIIEQWKVVEMKKHNEFLYCKSLESKKQETKEGNVCRSVSDSIQKAQPNSQKSMSTATEAAVTNTTSAAGDKGVSIVTESIELEKNENVNSNSKPKMWG